MINKSRSNKKILLVDDDQSISRMLSMLLETRGYAVDKAASGKELFENISDSTDLILLDLSLPDQDGLQICRKLKEEIKTRHIPIIILSGQMLNKDIVESLYLGADDCILKPVESEELLARMEAVTRRNNVAKDETHRGQEQEIICELARIIEQKDITPYFQPIINFSNYSVVGFEALCRPNTATVLSNPEMLFKMALKFGMYEHLELLSWEKALEYSCKYLNDVKLFLNCNPFFVESGRCQDILNMMYRYGVSPANIVLEITERSAVTDYQYFYEQIDFFRKEGFKFAVDDVGGGFASLESIVKIKPEVLKIERHIVNDIYKDPYKYSMVKFILAFCEENHIACVAEGIEQKEELDFLATIGVNAGQGYYLYKPAPYINFLDIQDAIWKVQNPPTN